VEQCSSQVLVLQKQEGQLAVPAEVVDLAESLEQLGRWERRSGARYR